MRLPFLVALILFANPFQSTAHAQPGTITLGILSKGWPPYILWDVEGHDGKGIMVDIFLTVCSQLDYEVNYRASSERRLRSMLSSNEIDAYPMSPEWVDDPSEYLWSSPVLSIQDILVSHTDSPVKYTEPAALKGKRIGVVRGYVYPKIDPLFESGAIGKVQTCCPRKLYYLLADRRVDAILTTVHVSHWYISSDKDLMRENFVFSETPIETAHYGFAFAKNERMKPFVAKFNDELIEMQNDGKIKAILDDYRCPTCD